MAKATAVASRCARDCGYGFRIDRAAVIVAIVRLRPITMPVWPLVIATMSLSFGAALIRWFLTRAGETDAAFLIDESLELDDRIATSRLIIERGGPANAVEEALIEDAAARLGNQQAQPWFRLERIAGTHCR